MEFHENRARQPFIGFCTAGAVYQKMVASGANAQSFAANERRTAERYRPASGPDQLKRAVFYRANLLHYPGERKVPPGYIHEIYQLMRHELPFLDTYPDKYYFLLNNERKTRD